MEKVKFDSLPFNIKNLALLINFLMIKKIEDLVENMI